MVETASPVGRSAMSVAATSRTFRALRRAAFRADGGGRSDAELLDAFLRDRDELAIEALIRRHGPLELGVCRRLLGNPHDAADAFQVVFLVLVQKSGSIRSRRALGPWLYAVAYRTSLKARARRQRRQRRETSMASVPERGIEMAMPADDVLALLDEELNALPTTYRDAV